MAPERVAIDAASASWIGAAIGALGLLGGAFEWARRRIVMISDGWKRRADEIESRVEVELQGQHAARIEVKTDLEGRLAKHEDATRVAILRLHERLDRAMTKDDGKRIEDKVDKLLDKFVNLSFGGKP
jgi:hypothetical protein